MPLILPDRLANVFIAYFVTGAWQSNCYVIADEDAGLAVAIDVGMDAARTVEELLAQRDFQLAGILLTHGHIDHCAQAAVLADAHQAPVWVHPADRELMTHPAEGLSPQMAGQLHQLIGDAPLHEPRDLRTFEAGVPVRCAGFEFSVTPAPGHTPGSVLLGLEGDEHMIVFTGDVLFAGSIGRSDFPGGDDHTMRAVLRDVVATLPPQARVLPGHGPFTTVADELATNPYLTDAYLEVQS